MTCIVDASVALKWYVHEAETAAAIGLIEHSDRLIAPDLIVAEVCSAAWKRLRRGDTTIAQTDLVAATIAQQFDRLIALDLLAPSAMAIARTLGHSVYDCFYLALAEREAAVLVTADRRLLSRVRDTPWTARVTSLAEYASKMAR
jgi:predicted nucleic acid-binding protein